MGSLELALGTWRGGSRGERGRLRLARHLQHRIGFVRVLLQLLDDRVRCGYATYLSRVEVSDGNALARCPVCRSNDAQEPWLHGRGGAVPDARNWSHDRDFHGRECRTPAAAAVRTP